MGRVGNGNLSLKRGLFFFFFLFDLHESFELSCLLTKEEPYPEEKSKAQSNPSIHSSRVSSWYQFSVQSSIIISS